MGKHDKTFQTILNPSTSAVRYEDVAAMLVHFGFAKIEGSGSRVKFDHAGKKLLFTLHSPHPSPEISGGALRALRRFLTMHQKGFTS
ncbi:MAG: type II toxin-antitoxin system HicA family toxin [Ottowia sp.]|nr:type II toxin-antitoxin system HicA family toxin [Ottowia sp.]